MPYNLLKLSEKAANKKVIYLYYGHSKIDPTIN